MPRHDTTSPSSCLTTSSTAQRVFRHPLNWTAFSPSPASPFPTTSPTLVQAPLTEQPLVTNTFSSPIDLSAYMIDPPPYPGLTNAPSGLSQTSAAGPNSLRQSSNIHRSNNLLAPSIPNSLAPSHVHEHQPVPSNSAATHVPPFLHAPNRNGDLHSDQADLPRMRAILESLYSEADIHEFRLGLVKARIEDCLTQVRCYRLEYTHLKDSLLQTEAGIGDIRACLRRRGYDGSLESSRAFEHSLHLTHAARSLTAATCANMFGSPIDSPDNHVDSDDDDSDENFESDDLYNDSDHPDTD